MNFPDKIPAIIESFHDKKIDGLEFCRLAYSLFDEIVSQENGGYILRERKGPVKQLVEEILPICKYIQTFYGLGQYISVRWLYGNQPYDAKLESKGEMVIQGAWPSSGTLEVTQAVHENEHLMRELLNSKGGGFGLNGISHGKGKRGARDIESVATVYNNQNYIDDMCEIVLKAIQAKILKLAKGDYPEDTTLVVYCSLITVFDSIEWGKLVGMIRLRLPKNEFKCIFLTGASGHYSAII